MQVLCQIGYYGSMGGVVLQPKFAEMGRLDNSEKWVIIAQRRIESLLPKKLKTGTNNAAWPKK